MTKKLLIIPQMSIGAQPILTIDPPQIRFFWGHGNVTLICGFCRSVLAEHINNTDFVDKLLKCNCCQKVNQVTMD